MRSLLDTRRQSSAAAPIAALLLFATLVPPSRADSTEATPVDAWASMELALRDLWTGDPAAQRKVAGDSFFLFGPLFEDHPGHDDADVARILTSLRSLNRSERDDFISYRLLGGLAERDEEIFSPLFLDALESPSPNLRWLGIRWFADHADPDALAELEYAWRHEERPWVKADLMIALVRQGSRDDSRDFLDLARGKDPSLAVAAIRALTMIGNPEVIPFLVKIARTSRSNAGLLALDALARWPESRTALEATLEASRSPHVDFQRHAAGVLGSFDDPEASARARELATAHVDPYVRSTALGALRRADPAVLVPLILQILGESPTPENAPAQSAAIGILRDLDDPSLLPQLGSFDFVPADSRFYELFWLKAYLARERKEPATGARRGIAIDGSRDGDVILVQEEPELFVITPPPAMLTVRCWEYPDVPGDPEELPRLPAGEEAKVTDHFEREHESWVRIDRSDCWIPLRFIESPSSRQQSKNEEKREETMLIRLEFDLPAVEVESDVAQGLMDAGLLEVIEPGDEVIGVAISIDPEDFDRILLLARSCGLNETMLDGEIYGIVSDLAPLYRGHPVLDRFRRTPPSIQGETDDVIDLEIEELSDR
jgi:HEAT repeat protein